MLSRGVQVLWDLIIWYWPLAFRITWRLNQILDSDGTVDYQS